MNSKRIALISLLLISAAMAQSWTLRTGTGFQFTRFDGEYFPGTGKVYFLGGRLASGATDGTIWSYDPVTQTYTTTGQTMPVPISNYEIALLRDNYDLVAGDTYGLYVFGGRNAAGAFVNNVQVYYPRTNRVRDITTDPYPNQTSGIYYIPCNAVVHNNKAYVLGGFQSTTTPYVSNAVYIYDPLAAAGTRWTQSPYSLINARGYIMGAVVDSFLYACGGCTFDGASLYAQSYVERFNLNTPGPWVAVASMPQTNGEAKPFGFSTGTPYYISNPGDLSRKLIIAGRGNWPAEDSACFIYDVATNAWSGFPSLARACRNMAGAFIPGNAGTNGIPGMWVWGGRHTSDFIVGDTAQFFQLQYYTPSAGDVGCTKIVAPTGIVDSNTLVTPACSVYNYGTTTESYNVRMRIGGFYSNTASVTSHAPGTYRYVTFPAWDVQQAPGTYPVRCSTELTGDIQPGNDRQTGAVEVRGAVTVHDVGCIAILAPNIAPGAEVDSGTAITPACSLYNFGNAPEDYQVRMKIGTLYDNTATVSGHAPNTYRLVTFPGWVAMPRGNVAVSCSTELTGDAQTANDRQTGTTRVVVRDASADAILAPAGTILPGTVIPRATVTNRGTDPASFDAIFTINSTPPYAAVYNFINLPAGAESTVSFPAWTATAGAYVAACSVSLANDMVSTNNIVFRSFTVSTPSAETGWIQLPDVPIGPKQKKVKDGGCLTYCARNDTDYVYIVKGNNTFEFYQFNTNTNSYGSGLDSIPAIGRSGKKKGVKKGGAIAECHQTGKIYLVKGASTLEFWEYDPATNNWTQKADVPTGGKPIKEGCGLASVQRGDTNFIYLLKGSGTTEFYRYNTQTDAWETKANAPLGASGKAFKNGSCITTGIPPESDLTIYALKAAVNEFYAYDVNSDVWATKASLPFIGRSGKKKKAKDGAAIAYHEPSVYCLKGGNTLEFWKWTEDAWVQLQDMGAGGGKSVKAGGALVYAASRHALYALRGNNTNEFWMYGLSCSPGDGSAASNIATGTGVVTATGLRIAPNPFTNATTISYSLPVAGHVSLKLYDVTGKLVTTIVQGRYDAGNYTAQITGDRRASGTYFLKLETGTTTTTAKLIIE